MRFLGCAGRKFQNLQIETKILLEYKDQTRDFQNIIAIEKETKVVTRKRKFVE